MAEYTGTTRDYMWTGLTSPNLTECKNNDCINKLAWLSDGSRNDHVPADITNLDISDEDHFCVRHKKSLKVDSADCDGERAFACEFTCEGIRGGTVTVG